MKQTVRTYGRMELAQAYFPAILPRSAWKKLKALLMDDPQTASYATLSRRTQAVRPRVFSNPPKPPFQSSQGGPRMCF